MGIENHQAPALISRQEAAGLCGVSLDTFDRHVRAKVLTKQVGRRVLVVRESVLAWLGAREGTPVAPDSKPAERRVSLSPRAIEILDRMETRKQARESRRGP